MKTLVQLIGVLIIIAGLIVLFKPSLILGWIERNAENQVLYYSAIISRSIIGIVLLLAAKYSRFPGVIKVFGIITIVAAMVFLFLGHQNFKELMTTMIPSIKSIAPFSGVLALAAGAFLIYAVSNKD